MVEARCRRSEAAVFLASDLPRKCQFCMHVGQIYINIRINYIYCKTQRDSQTPYVYRKSLYSLHMVQMCILYLLELCAFCRDYGAQYRPVWVDRAQADAQLVAAGGSNAHHRFDLEIAALHDLFHALT